MIRKIIGMLLAFRCVIAFQANCSSKFSDLGYSISTVICPAGCWRQSHSLCGTGTYGDGPVCLAAIHAGVISDCGGVAHVYETTGFKSSRRSLSHTVWSSTCGTEQKGYTFQMTCNTAGNTEFDITKVTCPSNCQSNFVCGSDFYTSDSSVCAAAVHSDVTGTSGGQVRVYRRQCRSSHPGMTNHGITSSTCGSTNISFNFIKIDDCVSSPCQHGGTCIDLIADYVCKCTAGYEGKNCDQRLYGSCSETTRDGAQHINSEELVYCSNGWRVFQRRMDGSIPDFHQKAWEEYAQGFGNFTGEFWLGLRKLHAITQRGGCKLRVELQSFQNETAYAEYSTFHVAGESDLFRISVGGYNGTAGDSLTSKASINGMNFSTNDRDNDKWEKNCATTLHSGGWWSNACLAAAPNGIYGEKRPSVAATMWQTWKGNNPMKFIQLGVRCD